MGTKPTGEDSIAKQIAPASHWPEMRVLILVVNDARKKNSSTSSMKKTVETSEFLKHRIQNVVPKQIKAITDAIKQKNFEIFARITMQDSNAFHATCLDTFPPCVYMTDISHMISNVVHVYNEFKGSSKVRNMSYIHFFLLMTFFAGCIYV